MSNHIPIYLRNRSLGLGTSKSCSLPAMRPNSTFQQPHSLRFSLDNFKERQVYQKDVIGHYGCVNAIELSPNEELVASGGDDRRVCIWATDELLYNSQPKMRGRMGRKHYSNIFALGFDHDSKVVYSGGNDNFFVMSDIATGEQLYGTQGTHGVHDISISNRSGEVLVTRCGGRDALYFHDPRTNTPNATITFTGTGPRSRLQIFSGQFNPDPSSYLIAVCGEAVGVRFIDRRDLVKSLFSRCPFDENAMYGSWNKNGTKFAHLVSGEPPKVYDFKECASYDLSSKSDDGHKYINSHTVKSVEWMDDDWLITGSDEFNIYGWNTRDLTNSSESPADNETHFSHVVKLKEEITPKVCLVGHRSIVNHVRFSSRYQFLLSSGVEKIIKVWNTRPFPASFEKPRLRKRGTTETIGEERGEENGTVGMRSPNRRRHRKSRTAESGRMLRYFDSLLHLERDGDMDTSEDELDSGSSDSELTDDESSSGRGHGVNRLVEDTDRRERKVPETRVIIDGHRAFLLDDDRSSLLRGMRDRENDDLMWNLLGSDSSEEEIAMGSDESDSGEDGDEDEDEEEEEEEEGDVPSQLRIRITQQADELVNMLESRRRENRALLQAAESDEVDDEENMEDDC